MACCIGAGRERFERELRRSRYAGRFVVVIEGSLSDVVVAARGFSHNAVMGTLASWTVRFCAVRLLRQPTSRCGFLLEVLASQLPSTSAAGLSEPGERSCS